MKVGDFTKQNQSEQLPIPYTDIIVKDLSTGAGTQSITGLGFKPSWIIFFGIVINTDFASWGFSNSTQNRCFVHHGDTDNFGTGAGTAIRFIQSAGSDDITAVVSSIDTDGFTLTWTVQSGSPTGAGRIIFMAFK